MTSPDKSLYLVQSDYEKTLPILERIETIYSENDSIILMGEAVLHYMNQFLIEKSRIYILESELGLLNEELVPSHIKILNPSQFADLVLQYNRCITFK